MKTLTSIFNDKGNFDPTSNITDENQRAEIRAEIKKNRELAEQSLIAIDQDHSENKEARIKETIRKMKEPGSKNERFPKTDTQIKAEAEDIVETNYALRREQHIISARENEELTIKKALQKTPDVGNNFSRDVGPAVKDSKGKYPDLR